MYRILIVEDDATISRLMADALGGWGHEARCVEDFERVLEDFHAFGPHLVLLDVSLPWRSGFHWCGEIRKISRVPVLFVTSAGDSVSLVTALHQGADDLIAKPFDLAVLVAKVQALLRRVYDFAAPGELLACRGAVLDVGSMALQAGGRTVELTRNEFRILQLLLENKGRVLTREAIMRQLWEDESFIDDNTLTVNVNRLRRKLDEAGLAGLIETRKGEGYLLAE